MTLHVYVKERYSLKKNIILMFSYLSLTIGTFLLFWSFYPIISFEIYSRLFIQQDISTPIPQNRVATSLQDASSVGSYNVYSSNLRDFVDARLWFPSKTQVNAPIIKGPVKQYTISIPKINIINAKVTVGGEDLSNSLVHYLPTSMPGEIGNVAIFGHSTLPTLYNPKNYKTIFTYLPSLEKGDKMYINVAGNEYEYEVFDIFIVNPDQVSVLDQKTDDSYLTTITCVPPGSVFKRLVVRSRLVKK